MGSMSEDYPVRTSNDKEAKQLISNDTQGTKDLGVKKIVEDVPPREKWSHKIDFLIATVGYAVGLGNVWRFPYLCYKNGGGAFLVPYVICATTFGIPMMFLETALGQLMSSGAIGVWNICPLFKGIGYAMTITTFLMTVYYIVILAWAFYYLFSSFTTELPWASCNNTWNTENCFIGTGQSANHNHEASSSGYFSSSMTTAFSMVDNLTIPGNSTDPATEFWERKVLQVSSGIDEVGSIRWELALCLLLTWIIVYLFIWKGVKLSGKVMYVTATSPYLLLTVLLIRGVTLPGASGGIMFYIVPVWGKLADPQVWADAGIQVVYSYCIATGQIHTLSSFNKWNHNIWRDSIVVCCINSTTSFFAGFVVFSILGAMAHQQNIDISQVAESGPGLAFITYPKAATMMPIAPLWSALFFMMILMLGLDSQFVCVETFVTAIADEYPRYLRQGKGRTIFVGVLCIVQYVIGLSMVTNGGVYVFQIFDFYAANLMIMLVAVFESMVIVWIYGVDRFYDNIRMMIGRRLNPYMKICWMAPTPIGLLVIFGISTYSYSEVTYNRTYIYPDWAVAIGWMAACSSVIWIPITIIVKLSQDSGTILERLRKQTRPRLEARQLRPRDDPRDLVEAYDNREVVTSSVAPKHGLNSTTHELLEYRV